jgi:flagellar motor protein MotB
MKIYRRRRRNTVNAGGSDTAQMMNLALFIMLLAFFIVLNTLSSYEEVKTAQVKRSIALSFSKKPQVEEIKSSTAPDPVQSMREGHTFDRLDALFNAQIASFEAVQSKSRGIMMVQVPYDDFVNAIMAVGLKNILQYPSRRDIRGNFFLPTLASILRTNIDGAPTRMEILLNTKSNPAKLQNQTPKEMSKKISAVGQLSQRLEKQGMPQKLLNIGVAKGDPKMVQLVFRKYIPFSPVDIEVEAVDE